MRGVPLWLVGVPLPIILLLYRFNYLGVLMQLGDRSIQVRVAWKGWLMAHTHVAEIKLGSHSKWPKDHRDAGTVWILGCCSHHRSWWLANARNRPVAEARSNPTFCSVATRAGCPANEDLAVTIGAVQQPVVAMAMRTP